MADETELAKLTINTEGVQRAARDVGQAMGTMSEHLKASASGANEAGQAMDHLGEHAQGLGFHIGKLRESFFEAFAARDLMWKALDAGKETLRAVIENTTEYEQANLRLDAVIKATGDASGVTAMQIRQMAEAMEKTTLFKSEDIQNAAAAMATFRNVQGQTFQDAIRYSADLASMGFGNINEVARNLGRALDEPTQASRMLRTYGIQLTKQQQEQIKEWEALGEKEKEQGLILDILKNKVSGVAESMDHGLAGATHRLATEWKDLTTNLGVASGGFQIGEEHMNGLERAMLRVVDLIPGIKQLSEMASGSPEELGANAVASAGTRYVRDLMPQLRALGMPLSEGTSAASALAYTQRTAAAMGQSGGYSGSKLHELGELQTQLQAIVNIQNQAADAANKEADARKAAAAAAEAQRRESQKEAQDAIAEKARKEYEKKLQSDKDTVSKLHDETIEMKMTNAEIVRYEILKNSGNRALAEQAYQLQTVIDKYKEEQKALDEAAKKQEEANRKKAEAAQRVEEYIERLNEESEALRLGDKAPPGGHDAAIKNAGGDPAMEYRIGQAEARIQFYKMIDDARKKDAKAEEAEAQRTEQLWEHSLKKITDDFASVFDKMLDGRHEKFRAWCGDLLATFGKTLSQLGAELMTAKMFGASGGPSGGNGAGGLLGGILSHIFGTGGPSIPDVTHLSGSAITANMGGFLQPILTSPTMHGGGIVGSDYSSLRAVSSAIFAGAPRYHTGLAGDELPAILRQGESVLTPEQMAMVAGAGGNTVHVHLNLQSIDGRDAARFFHENQGHIARVVTDAVNKSHTYAKRMSGK